MIIRNAYASKYSIKEKDGYRGWRRMSPTVSGIWQPGPQVMTLLGEDLSGAASVEEYVTVDGFEIKNPHLSPF